MQIGSQARDLTGTQLQERKLPKNDLPPRQNCSLLQFMD